MKIIHTADIHLDSPLSGIADGKTRRAELLRAFSQLAAYADNNAVEAVIVAGDLFDERFVSESTVNSVAEIINTSSAEWFVLRGNHGDGKPYEQLSRSCKKLHTFGNEWQTYTLGNVAITGRELGKDDAAQWSNLKLSDNYFNILTLHGDIDDDSYGLIDKKVIAEQPISFVALGHRHSFQKVRFGRVSGCYSGVLETRGFDEAAPTGFVLLDTSQGKVTFVQQHIRAVESVRVDVSSAKTDLALEKLTEAAIADVSLRNYLNVEFVGKLNDGVNLDNVINLVLKGKYYSLRTENKTVALYDYEKLMSEVSLSGEFVKLAMQITNPVEREAVLELGMKALNGEDVE